jgi:Uma2 family endonuclease
MAKVLARPTRLTETMDEDPLEAYRKACGLFPHRRVELINKDIVVRAAPTDEHNDIVHALLVQLFAVVTAQGWRFWTNIMLFLGTQSDRYIPDLTVVPGRQRMWGKDAIHADDTLLVVEVVSPSSTHDDHTVKPKNCAAARVPLYMVIDKIERTVRLLGDPGEQGYREEVEVPFGKPLELPEPWNLTIDTGVFGEEQE